MHIVAVSLNYKIAPVEIREKLTFDEATIDEANRTLRKQKSVLENVILSTCNRTEIYAVVDQLHTGRYYIKEFLSKWFGLEIDAFSPYLQVFENDQALLHLFRVTCGLNSMVLGETQILGQVRESFYQSLEEDTTGTIFNQLFKQAITLAKRSHSETEIGENAVSVSYAAVELSKKIFGQLKQKHILIVGAGKMGELAAKNLFGQGVTKVSVINRTFEKAVELADRFHGQALAIDQMENALVEADIVISSTGSKNYVITREMMETVEKRRKGNPLFMVDIAVPRDLDPSINELESVFLYDIDDLEGIVEANLEERKKEAEKIEAMIQIEISEFKNWLGTLGVVPVISALRNRALNIQAQTMNSIERKMPNLTDRERKLLSKHTKSIINQMIKEPISTAKELAGQKDAEASLQLFMKIFGIEEDVEKEIKAQIEQEKVVVPLDPQKQWENAAVRQTAPQL